MAWGRSTDGREFHRKYDGLHRISSCLMCFLVLYRFIFDCTLNLALLGELDQVFASYLGESTTPMWLVFNWVESTTTARWVTFGRCCEHHGDEPMEEEAGKEDAGTADRFVTVRDVSATGSLATTRGPQWPWYREYDTHHVFAVEACMGKDGEKSKGHPMRNAAPTNLMAEGYIDVEGTYILSPCANERRNLLVASTRLPLASDAQGLAYRSDLRF